MTKALLSSCDECLDCVHQSDDDKWYCMANWPEEEKLIGRVVPEVLPSWCPLIGGEPDDEEFRDY